MSRNVIRHVPVPVQVLHGDQIHTAAWVADELDVVPPAIAARPVSSAWGVSVLVQLPHGGEEGLGGGVDRGQGVVGELLPEAVRSVTRGGSVRGAAPVPGPGRRRAVRRRTGSSCRPHLAAHYFGLIALRRGSRTSLAPPVGVSRDVT